MQNSHPSSILQHWSWEHTPCHVGHLITDLELELLNKRICIIICTSHLEEEFFHVTGVSHYNSYNKQKANRNAAEALYNNSPCNWKKLRFNCSTLSTYPQQKQLIPWNTLDEIFFVPLVTRVLICSMLIQKHFVYSQDRSKSLLL